MTHEVHIARPGLTHPIKPAGFVMIDGETGEALPASALAGITLAELLASVLPVAPNVTRGGGALDANTQRVTLATDGPGVASLSSIDGKTPPLSGGAVPVAVQGLGIPAHTNMTLSYTGQNLTTVVYKNGATTVATVTLTYDTSNNITSVTKA